MRTYGLALAVGLLLSAAVAAQPPQPQPPPQGDLDTYLLRWEKEMQGVKNFIAPCTRTELHKGFDSVEVYEGVAKFSQPNRASLEMQRKGRPEIFERYICTGTYVYTFSPSEKKVYAYELPKPKQGQVADDNALSLIFSVKAKEAKERYDLKLLKEDQYYIYLEIQPRLAADKADFTRARLVLYRDTFMPRELWFEAPTGDETKWDIPRVEVNVPGNRLDIVKEFSAPAVPQGWKLEQNIQPRVIRDQKP